MTQMFGSGTHLQANVWAIMKSSVLGKPQEKLNSLIVIIDFKA